MTKWMDKLKEWENGKVLQYPKKIKKAFYYETTCITKSMKGDYKAKFIPNTALSKMTQNYKPFLQHIQNANNRYVVSFLNLSKRALLVIPVPRVGKQFTTIKDFIDNASNLQQRHFWKEAAHLIQRSLQTHNKLWVSTHGSGVPYFHLRIESFPKYYQTEEFT